MHGRTQTREDRRASALELLGAFLLQMKAVRRHEIKNCFSTYLREVKNGEACS